MPESNPTQILLEHNLWATRNLVAACEKLTDEAFNRRFEMGLGSLHDTVVHLISATRGWSDLLAGRELREPLAMTPRSVAELQAMVEEVFGDFTTLARSSPLEELVTRSRGGRQYTFPRGGVITHVTTHAMHHRAQCLNMLRHVGLSPLPQSSVLEWMIAHGAA